VKLLVTTPTAVIVDVDDATYVRGESETGSFGVLPRHADLLTVLTPSVLTWRDGAGREHYVAVRGGVLTIAGGERVRVATREAIAGDDLGQLETAVVAGFREAMRTEAESHGGAARMQLIAQRLIFRYLRSERDIGSLPAVASLGAAQIRGE